MNWQSGDMESRRERRLRAARVMREGYRAQLSDDAGRCRGQPLVNLASLPNGVKVVRWYPVLETHPQHRTGRPLPDYAAQQEMAAGVSEGNDG